MTQVLGLGWSQVNVLVFLLLIYAVACLAPVVKGRRPAPVSSGVLVVGLAVVLWFAGFWTAG